MAVFKNGVEVKSTPGGKPNISAVEAGLDSLSKEVLELKKDIKDQRNENKNIIIGVLVAFILIVMTIGIEVILFHSNSDKNLLEIQNRYFQEIQEIRENNFQGEIRVKEEINSLKEKPANSTSLKGNASEE